MTPSLPKSHHSADSQGYLVGQFLLAAPSMRDPRFARAVILVCQHTAEGAMGIIINKPLPKVPFKELIQQFNLKAERETPDHIMHFGGPVETSRGFVVHSDDYVSHETESILPGINITATIDVVRHIAANNGPDKCLMALGYAGWSSGQLEEEIHNNAWLVATSHQELLFDTPHEKRWQDAYQSLGLSPGQYISNIGSA